MRSRVAKHILKGRLEHPRQQLSAWRVAELLGISNLELDERLNPEVVEEPFETYA